VCGERVARVFGDSDVTLGVRAGAGVCAGVLGWWWQRLSVTCGTARVCVEVWGGSEGESVTVTVTVTLTVTCGPVRRCGGVECGSVRWWWRWRRRGTEVLLPVAVTVTVTVTVLLTGAVR